MFDVSLLVKFDIGVIVAAEGTEDKASLTPPTSAHVRVEDGEKLPRRPGEDRKQRVTHRLRPFIHIAVGEDYLRFWEGGNEFFGEEDWRNVVYALLLSAGCFILVCSLDWTEIAK